MLLDSDSILFVIDRFKLLSCRIINHKLDISKFRLYHMTMSTSENCKDGASKSNDGICEVNNMLQNMNTVSVCANCGKENSTDNMNMCNKCKQVSYCNAACKKKHRHKHKKDCEEHIRLATENEAKLHDEKLFKPPLPAEDCPICFLRMPILNPTGKKYYACCGKMICSGCVFAPL